MDDEEIKAKKIAQYNIGQDLSEFSIDEVSNTIEALETEIERLKTTKTEKSNHLNAAASLFKT